MFGFLAGYAIGKNGSKRSPREEARYQLKVQRELEIAQGAPLTWGEWWTRPNAKLAVVVLLIILALAIL